MIFNRLSTSMMVSGLGCQLFERQLGRPSHKRLTPFPTNRGHTKYRLASVSSANQSLRSAIEVSRDNILISEDFTLSFGIDHKCAREHSGAPVCRSGTGY